MTEVDALQAALAAEHAAVYVYGVLGARTSQSATPDSTLAAPGGLRRAPRAPRRADRPGRARRARPRSPPRRRTRCRTGLETADGVASGRPGAGAGLRRRLRRAGGRAPTAERRAWAVERPERRSGPRARASGELPRCSPEPTSTRTAETKGRLTPEPFSCRSEDNSGPARRAMASRTPHRTILHCRFYAKVQRAVRASRTAPSSASASGPVGRPHLARPGALAQRELGVAGVVAVVHVVVDRVEARERAGVAALGAAGGRAGLGRGVADLVVRARCSRPGTCGRARTSGRPRGWRSRRGCSWRSSRPAARRSGPGCRRCPGCLA